LPKIVTGEWARLDRPWVATWSETHLSASKWLRSDIAQPGQNDWSIDREPLISDHWSMLSFKDPDFRRIFVPVFWAILAANAVWWLVTNFIVIR
jgi:hypothetical protein